MTIDNLFKTEPQEPYKMSQNEFVEKTRAVLNKICDNYSQGWQSIVLVDGDYPEENICEKCTGVGVFLKNGEEKDCIQDKEQGDCFYRFCDYEQVGIGLEDNLEDIFDLLSVDEIFNNEQDAKLKEARELTNRAKWIISGLIGNYSEHTFPTEEAINVGLDFISEVNKQYKEEQK